MSMSRSEREGGLPVPDGSKREASKKDELGLVVEASTGMGYRQGIIKTRNKEGRGVVTTVFYRRDEFGMWIPLIFDNGVFDGPRSALDRAESRLRQGRSQRVKPGDFIVLYDGGRGGRGGGPRQ